VSSPAASAAAQIKVTFTATTWLKSALLRIPESVGAGADGGPRRRG